MKTTAFTQRAKGEFTVMLAPGTPHCGPDQADHPIPGHFSYAVEIDYDDQALDSHGFLLDNLDFQNYFNSLSAKGPIGISCENLAKQSETAFCEMIGNRRKDCQSVRVTIFPMPGVSVEYECHPNQISLEDAATEIMAGFSSAVLPFLIGLTLAALPMGFILWLFTKGGKG